MESICKRLMSQVDCFLEKVISWNFLYFIMVHILLRYGLGLKGFCIFGAVEILFLIIIEWLAKIYLAYLEYQDCIK